MPAPLVDGVASPTEIIVFIFNPVVENVPIVVIEPLDKTLASNVPS